MFTFKVKARLKEKVFLLIQEDIKENIFLHFKLASKQYKWVLKLSYKELKLRKLLKEQLALIKITRYLTVLLGNNIDNHHLWLYNGVEGKSFKGRKPIELILTGQIFVVEGYLRDRARSTFPERSLHLEQNLEV